MKSRDQIFEEICEGVAAAFALERQKLRNEVADMRSELAKLRREIAGHRKGKTHAGGRSKANGRAKAAPDIITRS
jgi:hypothetical protein